MLAITHSSIFLQWQTPIRFSKEVLQKSSVVLVCFVLGLRLLEHALALNCWKISSSGLDYWNIELDGMQTWFLGNKLYYLFLFSFSPIYIYIYSLVLCFIVLLLMLFLFDYYYNFLCTFHWADLSWPTFHYWLYPVWLCMWQIIKNPEPTLNLLDLIKRTNLTWRESFSPFQNNKNYKTIAVCY